MVPKAWRYHARSAQGIVALHAKFQGLLPVFLNMYPDRAQRTMECRERDHGMQREALRATHGHVWQCNDVWFMPGRPPEVERGGRDAPIDHKL